ncbi:SRPBCC family protein [Hamadaea sp. NPDC050747]|uniref:SRPBCC family protein n=1 Tax=Hamadaea sp. NPDC050747 TaxID=3155789 RepID=UPI0033CDE706
MAVVEKVVPVSADRVFAVLADGWTYSDWVVGTAHIRDVDTDWPAPGSHIYHQAAGWPLALKDKTVAVSCDPPHELVMRPHLWPFGELTVRLRLTALSPQETKVTLAEEFAAGPLRWTRNKLDDLLLHYRNREALRRLAELAARRFA